MYRFFCGFVFSFHLAIYIPGVESLGYVVTLTFNILTEPQTVFQNDHDVREF